MLGCIFFLPDSHDRTQRRDTTEGNVDLSQETCTSTAALGQSPQLQASITSSSVIGFCGSSDSGNWESWYFLAWREYEWSEGRIFSAPCLFLT